LQFRNASLGISIVPFGMMATPSLISNFAIILVCLRRVLCFALHAAKQRYTYFNFNSFNVSCLVG
jgi:hypothetical protein